MLFRSGGAYTLKTTQIDTVRKRITLENGIGDGDTCTIKVVLTPNGANRPAIKSMIVF